MEITVEKVVDDTPKGLSTGFRLKLHCACQGKTFQLDLPILLSKDVMEKKIPLQELVVSYLRKNGLDEYPDLFVDSRKLDLSNLGPVPQFPLQLTLGGHDILAQKALERLTK